MNEPGWYPDPANPSQLRFWDGAQWTQEVDGVEQVPGPIGPRKGVPGWLLIIVAIVVVGLITVAAIRLIGGDTNSGGPAGGPLSTDNNSSTPSVSGWNEGLPTPDPSSAAPANCDPGTDQVVEVSTAEGRLKVGPLSMPSPGTDWQGPLSDARMPLGANGHLYQFPLPEEANWASSMSIGVVVDPEFQDTRSTTRLISQCILTSGFYSTVDVEMDDYADKPITVDGIEGSQADFTVRFDSPELTTKGSTLRLIVLDSSPRTYFFAVVPMERTDQILLVEQVTSGLQAG